MPAETINKLYGVPDKATPLVSTDKIYIMDSEDEDLLKKVDIAFVQPSTSVSYSIKTSDTSVTNNNTTWNEDTEIAFTLDEQGTCTVDGICFFYNATTSIARGVDVKFVINGTYTFYGMLETVLSIPNLYKVGGAVIWDGNAINNTDIAPLGVTPLRFSFSLNVGAGATSLKFAWKPTSNVANAMVLKAGSYINFRKQL